MATVMAMAMGVDRVGCGKRETTFRSGSNSTPLYLASRMRVAHRRAAGARLFAAIGCVLAATPVLAETWKFVASASATETYTNNVNYSPSGSAEGDFATSLGATLNINGDGARLKLHGSIGATEILYASHTENNSFAPQVNLTGLLEAIEKFAYVEARAYVSQTFISPFGAQPGSLVNATQNRYTQQAYSVSPYIKGVLGSSNISYLVRDDNYWTIATNFGDSANPVPNAYANVLNASMSSPVAPWGWTLEYNRSSYNNGLSGETLGGNSFTTQIARLILPYQIDPQVQVAPRIGYEDNQYPLTSSRDVVYGIGGQWNPTDRTNVSGFWEHRFFGSSYSAQFSHRLPNAALSANFARGLSTFPQQALFIPAGASVAQFLDAAFATRIPDPAERAQAVEQFLAKTGLPPTLASPISFYSPNNTVQQTATISLVLIGALNSLTFSIFNSTSEAISGTGAVLPPALQFGQNNTQTGGGIAFTHRLSGVTNLGATASYGRTKTNTTDGPLSNARTNNGYASVNVSTQLSPKTVCSAGVSYSRSEFPGSVNTGSTSAFNAFAGITHTF